MRKTLSSVFLATSLLVFSANLWVGICTDIINTNWTLDTGLVTTGISSDTSFSACSTSSSFSGWVENGSSAPTGFLL